MGLTAQDFKNQLQALLPAGPAWDIEGAHGGLMLDAWAEEFLKIQSSIDGLIDEADPRLTYQLLIDYERIFGLPPDCVANTAQTLQQRHNALVVQMTGIGGQTPQYFIDLAAAAGFVITITEFRPWTVGMTVDQPIIDSDWAYAWQVNAPSVTVSYFTTLSGVDEPLSAWGNELLECVINRFKPAHTHVLFSYS